MVFSKEKKLEMLNDFTDKLDNMKMMGGNPENRKTSEWKAAEKDLLKTYHALLAIDPVSKCFDEEISQTLHPEYFYD